MGNNWGTELHKEMALRGQFQQLQEQTVYTGFMGFPLMYTGYDRESADKTVKVSKTASSEYNQIVEMDKIFENELKRHKIDSQTFKRLRTYECVLKKIGKSMTDVWNWIENFHESELPTNKNEFKKCAGDIGKSIGDLHKLAKDVHERKEITQTQLDKFKNCLDSLNETFQSIDLIMDGMKRKFANFPITKEGVNSWKTELKMYI